MKPAGARVRGASAALELVNADRARSSSARGILPRMPKRRNAHCRNCGGHRDAVGPISRAGNCGTCARDLLVENARGIVDGAGDAYERWVEGQKRAVNSL